MKATLTFDLPEDKTEFFQSIQGPYWESTLWDLDNWLRGEIKYNNKEEYQPVRDMLYEIKNEYNLQWSE